MTRDEARERASRARGESGVPEEARVASVDPRYIEVAGTEEETAHLVRDTRVWVVRFRHGPSWTDLAVEDGTGDIVRVERSR